MTLFLALDIGCLECGESTRPLGLFKSHDEAQAACAMAVLRNAIRESTVRDLTEQTMVDLLNHGDTPGFKLVWEE